MGRRNGWSGEAERPNDCKGRIEQMKINSPRFRPSRRGFLLGSGALAIGMSFSSRFSLAQEEKKLNFYNWDTYIGETTLADFQKETGIEVKMDLFADND